LRYLFWLKSVSLLAAVLAIVPALPALAQPAEEPDDKVEAAADANEGDARSIRRQQLKAAQPADPVVLAIVESKPTKPDQLILAVQTLVSLERFDLAKKYLAQLLADRPDADTLNALVIRFGSPAFEQIAEHAELAPEGAELAKLVAAAIEARRNDTARLAGLVNDLTAADAATRQKAMVELKRAGSNAVAPLVKAASGDRQTSRAKTAQSMLPHLGGDAIDPLIAVLQAGNPNEQLIAAEVLGDILRAERALVPLVIASVSPQQEANHREALAASVAAVAGRELDFDARTEFLLDAAQRQFKQARVLDAQDNYGAAPPQSDLWQWNSETGELTHRLVPTTQLTRTKAKQAIEAYHAAVDQANVPPSTRHLQMLILLDEAKHRLGFDKPLAPGDVELGDTSADELNDVLKLALERNELAAAVGAVEILGQIGSPQLLVAVAGQPTALARAAKHGNRRLRFAAIQAIVAIRPTESFAGASAVAEGLQFFASTLGMQRALVVDPRAQASQQVASYLNGLGYDTEIATNGRAAFEQVVNSADFELAFVHMAIDRPRIDDLLLQLRKDSRTAELPIALIAVPGAETTADRLARGYQLIYPVAEPQDAESVAHIVERLMQQPGAQPADAKTRMAQAAWATQTVADLVANPVPWVDAQAIARALKVSLLAALPDLTGPSIELLGNTPDGRSQTELARIVLQESLPATTRKAASLALARNITGNGMLLPRSIFLNLYDRYNENAGRNADTHEVLTTVLDAMETEADNEQPATTAPAEQ
jgi:CheY-like chemotaxis protein